MQEIRIERTTAPKAKPQDESKLGFGKIFTDHMYVMEYNPEKGWHDPKIVPYQPISLDPSAMVFHYGQEMFEGMKAYKTEDGRVLLFRPDKNIERANNSNRRLCIPEIPADDFLNAIKTLVGVDATRSDAPAPRCTSVRSSSRRTRSSASARPIPINSSSSFRRSARITRAVWTR